MKKHKNIDNKLYYKVFKDIYKEIKKHNTVRVEIDDRFQIIVLKESLSTFWDIRKYYSVCLYDNILKKRCTKYTTDDNTKNQLGFIVRTIIRQLDTYK